MTLKEQLVETMLHMPPASILSELPEEPAMRRPAENMHSIAEIVAHMDFWQSWFLKRCRGEAEPMAASASIGWPKVAAGSWDELRASFLAGTEEAAGYDAHAARLEEAVTPAIEFPPMSALTVGAALSHTGQHNSHHLGQVILVRQWMGLWPPPGGSWTW